MLKNLSASIQDAFRLNLRRRGLDIVRYFPLAHSLRQRSVDLVIDVGANRGQFAKQLRQFGFAGQIISMEPEASCFEALRLAAKSDERWEVICAACGETDETRDLHVAQESVFSSLLEAESNAPEGARTASRASAQRVQVRRLDELLKERLATAGRFFLKVDTQGFDDVVIKGASGIMDSVVGIQTELSYKPMYRGQPPADETIRSLRCLGFALWWTHPVFTDRVAQRLVEVDGIFWRE